MSAPKAHGDARPPGSLECGADLRKQAGVGGRNLVATLSSEAAQELLLFGGEVGRGVDHDLDEHVASPPPVEVRHAAASQPEDPSRLCAGGYHQVLGAVEGVVPEVDAQGGLGHREMEYVDEVLAVALEALVGTDPQVDVQVAIA